MVWWSVSLRYETGEKKLNEVDLISQRVEMISSVPTTVTKSGVEFNLRIGRRVDQGWTLGGSEVKLFWEGGDDFGVDVLRFHTCLTDILGFLEKFGGGFEQDIDDESKEDRRDEESDNEV
ncbi:hypothetical protein Tco_0720965 [Tanacetum coccineum]